MRTWKIVVADDDTTFADALTRSLLGLADIKVVGTAYNGAQAVELARTTQPEVLLIDIEMPVMNGIEIIRLLHKEMPDLLFVVLTVFKDSKVLRSALLAGAKSYLLKEEAKSTSRIVEAIREVVEGGGSIPSSLAAPLLAVFPRSPEQNESSGVVQPLTLTNTEREVLEAMALGKSNRQIANAKFVSVHTTKKHVASILGKLHASNRTEAARIALQSGLINDIDL